MKKIKIKHGTKYTEADLIYLESSWGKVSIARIASKLQRTEGSIKTKAYRLGLGAQLENKDYLIAVEVAEILGIDRKTLKNHLEKRGLKHKVRKLEDRKLITITYEDMLDWLVNNTEYWKATRADRLGLLSLGMDENFLDKKMKEDIIKEQRTTLNDKEIEKIKKMYKQFITYEGIALALDKEYSTVKWKIHTLIQAGELERNTDNNRLVRVTKRENYGWAEWQDRVLITEFKNGKTLKEISEMVGKSLSATKSRNQMLTKRIIKGLAI